MTHQERSKLVAQLRREIYDEAQVSAPGGVALEGEARAYDIGYRRGCNAAKRELIARLLQGDVEAGIRELRDATPKVVLPRHWLAEHEAAVGEGD